MTLLSPIRLAVLFGTLCGGCAQLDRPATAPDSIAELNGLMSRGLESSEALVARALEAQERDAAFNAFISVDTEGALAEARRMDALRRDGTILGPLHGVPIVVKDNVHVAGLPNTAGTPYLRDFTPTEDATAVKRLRAAGGIVLGKTNMHELAFGITSANREFGAVGNAYDSLRFAGGSSGGTATAIAREIVVAGLGTDTGGSSRIPAALNGIVGFRPTTGRYPADGITRISSTRDTVGPMARTVADVQLLDLVLSGEAAAEHSIELSDLRLGVPRAYFYENLEPEVANATDDLLALLVREGATLVDANLPSVETQNGKVGFPIVIYESRELLSAYLRDNGVDGSLASVVNAIASPDVKGLMQSVIDPGVPRPVYEEALSVHRPELQRLYRDYFRGHRVDAVIFPTTPLTARPIEGSDETVELNGGRVPTFPTFIRNTDPGSNAGIPGLSIPLGKTEAGLPFGIEIDGPANSDQKLLAIGALLEALILSEAKHSN